MLPSLLFGEVDSIPVWEDTYMRSNAATTNYSTNTSLSVANSLADDRVWLKPNMSAASLGKLSNAVIDSVKLYMYKTATFGASNVYV